MSIARSLLLALLGMTLTLAVIAGLGVASLYGARQDYEDRLSAAYATEVATANLLSAGVIEEAILRGDSTRAAQERAAAAYEGAAAAASAAARGDRRSEQLVTEQVRSQAAARTLARRERDARAPLTDEATRYLQSGREAFERLSNRQDERRRVARDDATADSRRAILTAAIAGGLAMLAALSLVGALVAGLRRPLDDLVRATRGLAAGNLDIQVREAGPSELRQLARAFNRMATGLRRAQELIDHERHRLSSVVASLSDGLVVCDADGFITRVNPRAVELFPELEPGARPSDVLPPLERTLDRDVQITHGDRTLELIANPLDAIDGATGTVLTIRDVTERARLERLKTQFLATASHELRSPLTSIKGFVELLSNTQLNAKQREFVDVIQLSTNRLVDLVADLLDVVRIEAGRLEVQRRPMALMEAVEEVVALMQPRIASKRQRIEVDVQPRLPAALADPTRVRQILTNLLTNAHLYTPEDGLLRIRLDAESEWVVLAVSDTGRGMTPEEVEQVFERFFRARDNGDPSGSGLGLSIVSSLVELHGGRIDVESVVGHGTTFTVRLPRASQVSTPREAIQGRRVLIVDDDARIASLVAEQLRVHGVMTAIARSGADAVAELRRQHYDGVTLDVLMPRRGGLDVLSELRASHDDVPVIAVSAVASTEPLAGEWIVTRPVDAGTLTGALDGVVLAGRSRVLVVGRPTVRAALAPELDRMGIEHEWASTPVEAGRLCAQLRFEVALVDAGIHAPQAVLAQLDLRGRRRQRTIIVFSDGDHDPAVTQLDYDPLPAREAIDTVLDALEGSERRAGAR